MNKNLSTNVENYNNNIGSQLEKQVRRVNSKNMLTFRWPYANLLSPHKNNLFLFFIKPKFNTQILIIK